MMKRICGRAQKCLLAASSGSTWRCRRMTAPRKCWESKPCVPARRSEPIIVKLIAQGRNRSSSSKIGDCLKEADETLYWMELLLDESFVPARRLQPLLNEADELLAILTTISK